VGFLSINYNKPGPGVDKDAPPKPRFFVFFEVVKRKFWHLIRVNLMYVLFNILALGLAFFISSVYLQKISTFFLNSTDSNGQLIDFTLKVIFSFLLVTMSVITIGPVQAGFTYILRNYSREEHSFIWWDFKENFKKNFKQGLAITAIDILVLYALGIAVNFYTSSSNLVSVAAASFTILSLVIFVMMHFYIYPMLVTVKLSVKNIYKNAFILTIMKLIPNFLMLVLNLVISLAAFYNIFIGIVLYIFILPSFVGLMNNFYINPVIRKYVVNEAESNREESQLSSFYKNVEDDESDKKNDNDGEL
jgi:uncharacterized membrane protein YesL